MLTTDHRTNLRKLADYLTSLPPECDHFDIACYVGNEDEDVYPGIQDYRPAFLTRCGSVACAIGHGPSAGIPIDPAKDLNWADYCRRAFGVGSSRSLHGELGRRSWAYLFGENWAWTDNSAQGAATRIYTFLVHGVPADF